MDWRQFETIRHTGGDHQVGTAAESADGSDKRRALSQEESDNILEQFPNRSQQTYD